MPSTCVHMEGRNHPVYSDRGGERDSSAERRCTLAPSTGCLVGESTRSGGTDEVSKVGVSGTVGVLVLPTLIGKSRSIEDE
jgi:hypothetical protein